MDKRFRGIGYMNAIKNFLIDNNMTQADFAKGIGVTQGLVGQWAVEIRPVSVEKALLIEDVFGIDAETLNKKVQLVRNHCVSKKQAV